MISSEIHKIDSGSSPKKAFNNNLKLMISNFDPETIFNKINGDNSPNITNLNLKSPKIFLNND